MYAIAASLSEKIDVGNASRVVHASRSDEEPEPSNGNRGPVNSRRLKAAATNLYHGRSTMPCAHLGWKHGFVDPILAAAEAATFRTSAEQRLEPLADEYQETSVQSIVASYVESRDSICFRSIKIIFDTECDFRPPPAQVWVPPFRYLPTSSMACKASASKLEEHPVNSAGTSTATGLKISVASPLSYARHDANHVAEFPASSQSPRPVASGPARSFRSKRRS